MLKAIIFDFDGVIADTEPIHLEAFKIVLNDHGIVMTDEQYFNKYLAYDDKTLFEKIFTDNGSEITENIINQLIEEKHILITELFSKHVAIFPGIDDFIKRSAEKYTLAIASGALKSEIEFILKKYGLINYFQSIFLEMELVIYFKMSFYFQIQKMVLSSKLLQFLFHKKNFCI